MSALRISGSTAYMDRVPDGSPHLYDQSAAGQGIKFLIELLAPGGKPDLPRNAQLTPLIGDPRNDENIILSQLQVAFLKFHNAVIDHVTTYTNNREA